MENFLLKDMVRRQRKVFEDDSANGGRRPVNAGFGRRVRRRGGPRKRVKGMRESKSKVRTRNREEVALPF
jgi:hypothetical protein